MTITTIDSSKAKIDWTKPVLWLFAAVMIVLIVLPMSWLALFSLYRQGAPSDAAEFRHAVHQPGFPRSVADDCDHRHDVGDHLLHCRGSNRLAGIAYRHAGAADHPRAGDGLVRDAAVSRRGGLGIAGRAQQRPAEPALSLPDRRRIGRLSVQHLFADRNHLRHLLLHLSVRVRAGRQRARQHAGRTRGCFRDSRRQGVDHGAARDDSAWRCRRWSPAR